MSKKPETQTKKLNKLTIKKETINDLNVKDSEQVKGGASYFTGTCGRVCSALTTKPCCLDIGIGG